MIFRNQLNFRRKTGFACKTRYYSVLLCNPTAQIIWIWEPQATVHWICFQLFVLVSQQGHMFRAPLSLTNAHQNYRQQQSVCSSWSWQGSRDGIHRVVEMYLIHLSFGLPGCCESDIPCAAWWTEKLACHLNKNREASPSQVLGLVGDPDSVRQPLGNWVSERPEGRI